MTWAKIRTLSDHALLEAMAMATRSVAIAEMRTADCGFYTTACSWSRELHRRRRLLYRIRHEAKRREREGYSVASLPLVPRARPAKVDQGGAASLAQVAREASK